MIFHPRCQKLQFLPRGGQRPAPVSAQLPAPPPLSPRFGAQSAPGAAARWAEQLGFRLGCLVFGPGFMPSAEKPEAVGWRRYWKPTPSQSPLLHSF